MMREIEYFEFMQKNGITASFVPGYYGSFVTSDSVGYE